jgi:hypothetical protein
MPIKSKAQQRLMYAAAAGKAKDGPSPAVAREFIEATPKESYSDMPEKKRRRMAVKRKSG